MNAKRVAAEAALQYVENGMRVGLGTGSTALEMLELLAERIRNGLTIEGIPTSEGTAARARELNIPLATDYPQRLANQVTLDGADRVDPEGNLIKGGGGALLREKLVARAADKVVIMVDPSKHLPVLGPGFALPVEIVPCPCVRAEDGLALSSRNQRLSPQARSRAAALPQALFAATRRIEAGEPVADVLRAARADLAAAGFDPVEYLELRDATTLGDPVAGRPARLLVAAMLDGIRLIDNTAVTLRT